MRPVENIDLMQAPVERSMRRDEFQCITTGKAGGVIPLKYIPVLREDSVRSSRIVVQVKMAETVKPLLNAVRLTVRADFVPFLAFERFNGMDAFNGSYQAVTEGAGAGVDFFQPIDFDKDAPFWKKLGVQWIEGAPINRAPLEAYNVLWNWRRKMRSDHIPLRTVTNASLCRAFWPTSEFWHIVPDFEPEMTGGLVELELTGRAPVSGIGWLASSTTLSGTPSVDVRQTGETDDATYPESRGSSSNVIVRTTGDLDTLRTDIWAELGERKVKLHLQNIETAKQTVAWAKFREKYTGITEEHLIDLLMEGIRVPPEDLKQPIPLDKKTTIFGYQERFATDAGNLDQSVTDGRASVSLNIRLPEMNTGGIILITAEIVPELIFERKQDRFLGTFQASGLPNARRDQLDPEKIEAVQNRFVDVHHSDPSGIFGYAPLNHHWRRKFVNVGGAMYRPLEAEFVEERQRIWSPDVEDPGLTEDFYLVPDPLPHTVFADASADPFEIVTVGTVDILGLTQFGPPVTENDGNWDAVRAMYSVQKIVQE